MLSSDQILGGLALVVVIALGCELLAARTRLPAIVLLLPAGFTAGAITNDTHPNLLFGNAFQPAFVSLGVGLILFEAGLRLHMDELRGGARRVVLVLIPVSVVITCLGVTVAAKLLFGLSWDSSIVIGAILVVSGPTVVLPLLAFVRPTDRVRTVLKWEGVLIDPIGALLGVLAFTAVLDSARNDGGFRLGRLLASMSVGVAIGLVGAALLSALLRRIQRGSPKQSVAAALMVVVGAVAGADLLREDSGFVAATVMGMVLANGRALDVSGVLEFEGTVVQLLIGILFVLISASVAPSTVGSLLGGGIALVAVMVLVIRPLAAALGTYGSALDRRERLLIGWLAPRGIVAAATASAFGPALANAGVNGAQKILPICFIAIFGTVAIYGLTAAPFARRLGLAGATAKAGVLVVGGHGWARRLAATLERAGVPTRIWSWRAEEQVATRQAGMTEMERLELDLESREAQFEDITDALLLTEDDGFNALMAVELQRELGEDHVYRLPPRVTTAELPRDGARRKLFGEKGHVLFAEQLTYDELTRRFNRGAEFIVVPPDDGPMGMSLSSDHMRLLFVVSPTGELRVVTAVPGPGPRDGDTTVWLAMRAGFSDKQRPPASTADSEVPTANA